MDGIRKRMVALVVVHGLLGFLLAVVLPRLFAGGPHTLVAELCVGPFIGLTFAQISLVGIWAGLGRLAPASARGRCCIGVGTLGMGINELESSLDVGRGADVAGCRLAAVRYTTAA